MVSELLDRVETPEMRRKVGRWATAVGATVFALACAGAAYGIYSVVVDGFARRFGG